MRFILLAASVLVLAGFHTGEPDSGCGSRNPGIDALHREWNAAQSRADVDSLMKLLEPHFTLVPGDAQPVSGRKELSRMLWSTFGRAHVRTSFHCQGRFVQGDIAYESGWAVETTKPYDGSRSHTTRQRVMRTLKRDLDGRWRFAWVILQPQ
jgi:uncharacterized protein (TIGR02246 family)